jgi:serine/threonine protein kinase
VPQKKKEPIDPELSGLSPRGREIASVSKLIQEAFTENGEPPVTTTDFYRIGKMLGRGAFGKVNLAMHKLVRRLVAIKSLNKECLTDEA